MDSGNSSGSMQSSSGGEEEYDSRAESSSISAFLSNQPQGHVGPFTTTSSDEPHPNNNNNNNTSSSSSHHLNPLTHHHTPMFDPLSSYMDPTIQRSITTTTLPNPINPSSPSLLSLDMVWSKPAGASARSEPNQPDLGPLMQLGGQTRGLGSVAAFPTTQQQQHPLPPQSANLLDQQAHNSNSSNSNMVRNPKKRSRASRRAPTTVLTTDTTNFRAMVQEFTGIPAPPFTSSPFPRTRLDLFGNSVAATPSSSGTIRSHLEPPPYQLLRPFAQKVQPNFPQSTSSSSFPLSSSSSMVDTLLAPHNNSSNSCANSNSINYQQVSSSLDHHLGLLKQQVNVNSMHNNNNPIFSFQSILQAPQQTRYPLGNNDSPLHDLASKTQPSLEIPHTSSTIDSSLKVGVLEELGLMSHANVNTQLVGGLHHHQNMVHSSSGGALSSVNNNNNNMGRITNSDGRDHGGGVFLRSLSGTGGGNYSDNIIQERVSNGKGKVNYTVASSPSDFHGEKGPDCGVAAAARTEGMVESWINCSSD